MRTDGLLSNASEQLFVAGFLAQDGQQRRGVDDHAGRPRSSYSASVVRADRCASLSRAWTSARISLDTLSAVSPGRLVEPREQLLESPLDRAGLT